MKNWHIQSGDPGSFSIAADARLVKTSYTNDQIWSLKLEGGEPPVLSFQTTYGLRAKNQRLFPRFVEGDSSYSDSRTFFSQPKVNQFYPNYLKVNFSPLEGIDVIAEYLVSTSNTAAGRIDIKNSRLQHRKITFQWCALLTPNQDGKRMAPEDFASTSILTGQTGDLYPVVYLTGGSQPSSGPYPALSIDIDLPPGDSRQIKWVHTALQSVEESFSVARETAARSWDAMIARLEVINGTQVEILTGNADWNVAFALAQKTALSLLVGPSEGLPHISFVLNRGPDQGYSPMENGLDYNYLWDGQTSIDTDYLSTFLLTSAPDVAKALFHNHISTQSTNGFIDYKIGLGGQRSNVLATPILVNLAWRIYQKTEDISFLESVYPKLLNFVQSWFSENQDRDGDGLPEWDRTPQTGYHDNPLFSHFGSRVTIGDISKTETPSLCSFLYKEIRLLIKMSRLLNQINPIPALEAMAENLKVAVETSWNESQNIYRNWDRESHFSPRGEIIDESHGSGEIIINREFNPPARLVINVETENDLRNDIRIFIHGRGSLGNQKIERIEADQFLWSLYQAFGTSEQIYSTIEYIEISGANPQDKVTVATMDFSTLEQTLLLPLWAGIPDEKRAQALVENTICNSHMFWRPFGIPGCLMDEDQPSAMIHMIWNNFIGEALLKYNFRREAARLVTKLMDAVVQNLKTHHSFYSFYNPKTGSGYGDRNTLRGLPPVKLFLETLGVRIISPTKIILQGRNPFPWPVLIHYKGTTISRSDKKTIVSFPGGQTAVVNSEQPRILQVDSYSEGHN